MKTILNVRCVMIITLMLIILPVTLRAQSTGEEVFAAIPTESRAQLIERLKLYVTYQRTANYEKLYDLYSEKTIKEIFKGQNKTEFSAAFRKGDEERKSVRMLEFKPTSVEKTAEDGGEFFKIYGEATVLQQGEIVKKDLVVEAHPQNGNWYFSAITTVQVD
jgi:hypothetical protein